METLRKKLQQELQRQPDNRIEQSTGWVLPVELFAVSYSTIERTTMDILMKMMLLTIQKLEVAESKKIARFLAVEPLFIEDLFNKMESARMIESDKNHYELTRIGITQLQSGIFEHPPEKAMKKLYYSRCHGKILRQESDKILLAKEKEFRLAKKCMHRDRLPNEEQLRKALLDTGVEATEGTLQKVLDHIATPEILETIQIPCVEFRLYNSAEDRHFARVWNTLTEEWDEHLEKLIDEQSPLSK